MADELIRKYAAEIRRINDGGTEGDFTWEGLLFSFLREVDESRTLKYEVETSDGDTAQYSVLQNVVAPVLEEDLYHVEVKDPICNGWRVVATDRTKVWAEAYAKTLDYLDARVVHADEYAYYDVESWDDLLGWTTHACLLSYDAALNIHNSMDSLSRIIDHDDKEEQLYDVEITKPWGKELYAHRVSYEDAQTYKAEVGRYSPKIKPSKSE